ncbi:MAG: class I SAM-dependent methyltransferase [Acidobacteriota bacterium]
MNVETLDPIAATGLGQELPCWCRQGQWAEYFRTKDFGLLRCSECGCFRIDPPAVSAAEELADFYTGYYQGKVQAVPAATAVGRTSRYWRVVDKHPALTRVGEAAVDIGCGDGTLCAELKASGWRRVIGIDMSKGRIARARKSHPEVTFFDVPLQDSGEPDNNLDLAILDNVIEHVPDPVEQLVAIRKKLRNGASLVLMTPNMKSGNFRLLGRRWTQELAPHVHLFLFTPASLSRLCEMAGFTVEEAGSFHLAPYSIGKWFSRLFAGELKGALWTAVQEAGSIFSRLIGSGPMVYVVATLHMPGER